MDLKEVKGSSQIAALGYDHGSKTLRIRFHTGAEYEYANVPPELHTKFLSAESKGKFFGAHIRGNSKAHPHTMVKAAPKKEK